MRIARIFVHNDLSNINYVVGCAKTGEALAIDPLDAEAVLSVSRRRGWRIVGVVNTHEHPDHISGNAEVQAATGAWIASSFAGAERFLQEGDTISFGREVLHVLETPGHTKHHISLLYAGSLSGGAIPASGGAGENTKAGTLGKDEQNAEVQESVGGHLFCGDTIFNAGVGNTYFGSTKALYRSICRLQARCHPTTRIYPGHDYFANNLRFGLALEPDNAACRAWLRRVEHSTPLPVASLADERTYNSFLRLDCPQVQKASGSASTDAWQVFRALRDLRNRW